MKKSLTEYLLLSRRKNIVIFFKNYQEKDHVYNEIYRKLPPNSFSTKIYNHAIIMANLKSSLRGFILDDHSYYKRQITGLRYDGFLIDILLFSVSIPFHLAEKVKQYVLPLMAHDGVVGIFDDEIGRWDNVTRWCWNDELAFDHNCMYTGVEESCTYKGGRCPLWIKLNNKSYQFEDRDHENYRYWEKGISNE